MSNRDDATKAIQSENARTQPRKGGRFSFRKRVDSIAPTPSPSSRSSNIDATAPSAVEVAAKKFATQENARIDSDRCVTCGAPTMFVGERDETSWCVKHAPFSLLKEFGSFNGVPLAKVAEAQYRALREESVRAASKREEAVQEKEENRLKQEQNDADFREAWYGSGDKAKILENILLNNKDYLKLIPKGYRKSGEADITPIVESIQRNHFVWSYNEAPLATEAVDANGVFAGATLMGVGLLPRKKVWVQISPLIEYGNNQNQGVAADEVQAQISRVKQEVSKLCESPRTRPDLVEAFKSLYLDVNVSINLEDASSIKRLIEQGWDTKEISPETPNTVKLSKRFPSS